MTATQIYKILKSKSINKAQLAYELFPDMTKQGARSKFFYKSNIETFTDSELEQLSDIISKILKDAKSVAEEVQGSEEI